MLGSTERRAFLLESVVNELRVDAAGAGPPDPSESQSAPLPEMAPDGRRARVLVVDDMPDNADSLVMLLHAMGHEAHAAYGGEAAVREAESFHPDLAILDLGMPVVDGYEACRRIKEQPWGQDIVVVALTGWGQERDRVRSRAAGFRYHIVKPVEASVLRELIETATHERNEAAGDESLR